MNTQISAICIANTQIREVNGLYSLADLHKASGNASKNKPLNWLRSQKTIDFIDEMTKSQKREVEQKQGISNEAKQIILDNEESLRERIIKTVNGGNNRGTFVCKELVVHYGMWISPAFSIQVIQTFLNSKQAPAAAPALPPANPYALTEQDERDLFMPLANYTGKLAGWLAKSKGVSKSQIEQQLVEQFGSRHEPFFKQSKRFYSRAAEWLQEELDKLPVVDFGVSRTDLLNIFKRQCSYKQDFENWNDYQLQSWLDEKFFRNHRERYLGYPTSLESASYAQLTVLVDKMKHILGADFKLLDLSQQQKAALPKLRGTDGSIGQALFNYGADTPDKSELMWALQDMATLRHLFDTLLVINWDNSQLNAKQLQQVKEGNTILNNLSTMLMEAAAETLKH